ncbi:MFS transporter [Mycolicibacterium goodii]|uniref:MFS transporter n=1 Tax=Mycolicibacterium goodii TaxID=134601 RepID=UPI001BDD02ED|nr:MFS transporter [Mycolicibacterium goodii]MBU8819664.1 MFS transporter [Mycolicibacterium goodii]MBU8833969.1 MFS transporter [Mycolicibacterium goodii]
MTHDTARAGAAVAPAVVPRPGIALLIVAVSTFLAMSVWFSASFVAPQLVQVWHLSAAGSSLLTIAVQLGFVVGAVASAATGLADAVAAPRLMCVGAIGAAAANVALLWADGLTTAVPLRLLTGMCLAAIYPPALKEISTWFRAGRGTALGVMIGALTLGSALPHLVRSFGNVPWQQVIVVTSVMTAAGGLLMLALRHPGPYPFPRRPFSFSAALASLRNRNVALANIGYMGHMWELYAMWAWVGAFLVVVPTVAASANAQAVSSALAFVSIGAGALGCFVGGRISDRYGRPQSALICLLCSGGAALALSIAGPRHLAIVVPLCVFWGFWVIADSAQFSALVTEHADPVYVGGAVSIQLALGYCTTAFSLWLVPVLVQHFSWSAALAALAVGPAIGAVAMVVLARFLRRETATQCPGM